MAKFSRQEKGEKKLEWENRILKAAFGLGLLATLLFLIAISTSQWVTVKYQYSVLYNETRIGRGEFYKTGHYHGLWRICRQEYVNTTSDAPYDRLYCRMMYFMRQPEQVKFGRYDHEILHFRRSSAIISLIGIALSIIGHAFTWYSMAELRYMFKRLAATLHLITAACCWVTVEVFKRSMDYTRAHLNDIIPPESTVSFGFSYTLGWIVFVFFLIVAIVLFACSRKRKGRRARSIKEAQENEPVVLGRV